MYQIKYLVRRRNTSIKCENKRTASRKKLHFLAVGDNTQLLPRSIFLFTNSVLGNLSSRTAAKVAWSLHISTPNSCSETREAQENLQIWSYFSCNICSVWHKTPHLLNWLENTRNRFKSSEMEVNYQNQTGQNMSTRNIIKEEKKTPTQPKKQTHNKTQK